MAEKHEIPQFMEYTNTVQDAITPTPVVYNTDVGMYSQEMSPQADINETNPNEPEYIRNKSDIFKDPINNVLVELVNGNTIPLAQLLQQIEDNVQWLKNNTLVEG